MIDFIRTTDFYAIQIKVNESPLDWTIPTKEDVFPEEYSDL